jgi:stearoyl-CoA desaturase (Delta-9 desaturase)
MRSQHAFPHDFRSGPSLTDWDPSKWIILTLHHLGFATGLRRARQEDLAEAKDYMHYKSKHGVSPSNTETWEGIVWNLEELDRHIRASPWKSVILIEGFAVDATSYLSEHVWYHLSSMLLVSAHDGHKPGGAGLLRKYSVVAKGEASHANGLLDASWAFGGGLNNHTRAARRRMQELRVAKIQT